MSDKKYAKESNYRLAKDKADLGDWERAQETIKEMKSKSEKGHPEKHDY